MTAAQVLRGDGRAIPLGDNTVDLVVTSPPYYGLRSYQDGGEHYAGQVGDEPTPAEFIDALLEVTRECVRVLKPTGSLWVNLGDSYATRWSSSRPAGRAGLNNDDDVRTRSGRNDTGTREKSLHGIPWRYAIRCMDELGLILRGEIVWEKANGMPDSATDRVRRSHEQWFHFTLEPRYYAGTDVIREPHTMRPQRRPSGRREDTTPRQGQPRQSWSTAQRDELGVDGNPLGKLPGSVWRIPTQPLEVPEWLGVDHHAAFPMEWPRRIIAAWSPAGVCVECGEGRRPTTEYTGERGREPGGGKTYAGMRPAGAKDTNLSSAALRVRVITGESCACNEPIGTPTGTKAGEDPSLVTGRAGLDRPRSDDAGRRVITRWEQRQYAEQLKASPHRAAMRAEAGGPAFAHYVRTDRSGARPIPEPLLQVWLERGWLVEPEPFELPATTPGVVLDVFGGTGTTALVAEALGRRGISLDLSWDYCRLAQWRTTDPGQRAVAREVDKPRVELDGQVDLLALLDGV